MWEVARCKWKYKGMGMGRKEVKRGDLLERVKDDIKLIC